VIIHALFHGRPLCGFSQELPRDWPAEHSWIAVDPRQPRIPDDAVRYFCKQCLPIVCGPEVMRIHLVDPETSEPLCGCTCNDPLHVRAAITDQTKNPNCEDCLLVFTGGPKKSRYDHLLEDDDGVGTLP